MLVFAGDAFSFLGNDSQAEVLTRFPTWFNSPVNPDCYSIDTSLPSKHENSCARMIAAELACCSNYFSGPQLLTLQHGQTHKIRP